MEHEQFSTLGSAEREWTKMREHPDIPVGEQEKSCNGWSDLNAECFIIILFDVRAHGRDECWRAVIKSITGRLQCYPECVAGDGMTSLGKTAWFSFHSLLSVCHWYFRSMRMPDLL